jgi:hypothetical protein
MLEPRLLVFLEIEAQPAGGEAVEALRLFAEPFPAGLSGRCRARTSDLLLVRQALSQLS